LKADFQSRVANTDSIGVDHDWSADKLYRHLAFLEKLVPRTVSMPYVESGAVLSKDYEPE
jgi:hypothetical protein